MSVNRTGNGNNGNNSQPQQQPQNSAMSDAFRTAGHQTQQQPQAETRSPNMNQPRSVLDIDRRLSRPMSRNTAGEAVIKAHAALDDILKKDFAPEQVKDYRLVILDGPSNMLALSAVLVCFLLNDAGTQHVAVHSLLVETAGHRLSNKTINIAGNQVEVTTVSGDAYDATMWSSIEQQLQTSIGRNAKIHDAGASVLPYELSSEDRDRLRAVLYNAGEAAFSVMDNALGGVQEPFNVSWVDNRDQLAARLDFSPIPDETATGLPVRTDFTISLQGVNNSNPSAQVEQVRDLTRVSGFVDLVYAGQQQQQPQYGFQPQQPLDTRTYFPRLVMTGLASEVNAITMELQLLGLSTSTLMSRNNAWAGVYRKDFNRAHLTNGDEDLRDIGAVGFEVNLTGDPQAPRDRINTKVQSFGDAQLYQLLGATVHQQLIYSMDVEEAGTLSWINLAFIAASENKKGAIDMIIQAADTLSMGQFTKLFPVGEPIAFDDQNRIHLGYYTTKNGERRDLRDVDYLAMLNQLGKNDMAKVVEWSDTFDRKEIPLPIRLATRLKLLQAVLGDSVRVKGFARRITFNPNFITALNQAVANAGLVIRPDNVANVFSGGTRGDVNIGQYAVAQNFNTSLYNYSTPGYGNAGRSFMGANLGRFGR